MSNLERMLPALVRAVEKAHFECEVLIVDNSLTGDTWDWLGSFISTAPVAIRRVESGYRGLARARLVGCMLAEGGTILMVDDDVHVPESWIDDLARPIAEGSSDLVAGRVILSDEIRAAVAPDMRSWLAENDSADDSGPAILYGAAFSFRRAVLADGVWETVLGGGAPITSQMEDILFSMTATARGWRTVMSSGPVAVHRPDVARLTRRGWLDLAEANGRSDAYVQHHFVHAEVRFLILRACRNSARLWLHRARHMSSSVSGREMELTVAKARSWGLLRERRSPPRYSPCFQPDAHRTLRSSR